MGNPWTVDATRRWLRRQLADGPVATDTLTERLAALLPDDLEVDPDEVLDAVTEGMDDVVVVCPHDILPDPLPDDAELEDLLVLEDRCLPGVVLLHRLAHGPSSSVDSGGRLAIDVTEDFDIARFSGEPPALAGAPEGVELRVRDFDHLDLVAPPAWFDDHRGDWIGITQNLSGGWQLLTWAADAPPPLDDALGSTITARLRAIPPTERMDAHDLFERLLVAVHFEPRSESVLRPMAPLSGLLVATGCSMRDGFIGGAAFDWPAADRARETTYLATRLGVGTRVVDGLMLLRGGAALWGATAGTDVDLGTRMLPDDRGEFLDALRRPGVAEVVVAEELVPLTFAPLHDEHHEHHEHHEHEGDALAIAASWAAMLDTLRPHADDRTRSRIDWMRSRLPGSLTDRLALLESARRADPRNASVLDDLVWFAALRAHDAAGRARLDEALKRWITATTPIALGAGGEKPPTLQQILRVGTSSVGRGPVRHSAPAVGRNEPCPCGSGRKYKQCHLGRPLDAGTVEQSGQLAPAPVRPLVEWAQALALLWYDRHDAAHVRELQESFERGSGGRGEALAITFVLDAVVFTPERVEQFVVEAVADGARFPSALIDLMEQWAHAPFRLCELEDRVVGRQVMLRDLRTGERLAVEGSESSRRFEPGTLLLGRVIPNGEAFQFSFGSVPVAWTDRDAMLQLLDQTDGHPDGELLLDVLCGRAGRAGLPTDGGPAMRNTDGDALLFHRTVLRPTDASISAQMIAERIVHGDLDRDEGDGSDEADGWVARWHLVRADDVSRTLRATVTLRDGEPWAIEVETNSARRRDEAVGLLRDLLGGSGAIEVAEEWTDDLDDVRLAVDLGLSAPAGPGGGFRSRDQLPASLGDEDIAEIRAEMARRWMQSPVPALGGITPVQAADDPTRRRDLVELLLSYRQGPFGGPSDSGRPLVPDPDELAAQLGIVLPRGR